MISAFHVACMIWFFVVGSVVGSFLNVVIYRLPWQKSVIWPDSRCPKCLESIAARDNVPILSWLALRGECRRCGLAIPPRYALVEALVGLLFVAVYVADIYFGNWPLFGGIGFAQVGYHAALVALLVAATFTDYDLQVIPDGITRTGMLIGLIVGAIAPEIRPAPATATTTFGVFFIGLPWALAGGAAGWVLVLLIRSVFGRRADRDVETFGPPTILAFLGWQVAVVPHWRDWGGLVVGLQGMLIGAATVWVVRVVGSAVFRKEAMGFGDVTLLAMIGAFLGWQAAVLTFFLAPFFGLTHAVWKMLVLMAKWATARKSSVADHEMPFGPYLAMAALVLVLAWPRVWGGWASRLFGTVADVARFALTGQL